MWETLIISPFTNVLLFIYNLVGQNFGIAIILFTLLIKLLTHPLTVKQVKSSQSVQKMNTDKRWLAMQEKYKDDKEKLAQAQMEYYKEAGVSPFSSCLPTLIQFPIIIGLYQTVVQALASGPLDLLNLTRHIYPGFLKISELIPLNSHFLWMDLGQPERLYIPGIPVGIPILAIIIVITTYANSKLITPPNSNPKDQSAQMMGMMNIYMPLLMGWMAYSFASGLAVYFVASNLISIGQYALIGNVYWENLAFWRKKPGDSKMIINSKAEPEKKSDSAKKPK